MSIVFCIQFTGLSSFDLLYLTIGIAIFGLPALSEGYDDYVKPFIMPIGLPVGKVTIHTFKPRPF